MCEREREVTAASERERGMSSAQCCRLPESDRHSERGWNHDSSVWGRRGGKVKVTGRLERGDGVLNPGTGIMGKADLRWVPDDRCADSITGGLG